MPKHEKPVVKLNSEDINKLKMAFVSPQTVKYNPIQLHFPHGPDGSPSFPEEKEAEEHLCWLWNLSQTLQNAQNTQNWPNFHPNWSNIGEVMTSTILRSMSLRNPTKCGWTPVSSTRIGGQVKQVEICANLDAAINLTASLINVHMLKEHTVSAGS